MEGCNFSSTRVGNQRIWNRREYGFAGSVSEGKKMKGECAGSLVRPKGIDEAVGRIVGSNDT